QRRAHRRLRCRWRHLAGRRGLRRGRCGDAEIAAPGPRASGPHSFEDAGGTPAVHHRIIGEPSDTRARIFPARRAFLRHQFAMRKAMPSFTRFRLSALGGLLALTVSVALPLAAHASPMQPSGPNPKAPAGPAPSPPPAEAATARPSTSTPGPSPAATATPATASVQPAAAEAPAGPAGITVSSWGFSQTSPKDTGPSPQTATVGRPLYVWMVLDGGEAAVDQLKNGSQVSIQVHWTNDNVASKAPALTSNLTVGRPDIAA